MAKKKQVEVASESPETAKAVEKTAKDVEAAQKDLKEAVQAHEEASVAHREATKEPPAVLGQHIYIEGDKGDLSKIPMPEDWQGNHERRLNRSGTNYEHVSEAPGVDVDDKPASIWVYRRM